MIALGGILYAAGLILMSLVETPIHMHLTAGMMLGLGLSATFAPSGMMAGGGLGELVGAPEEKVADGVPPHTVGWHSSSTIDAFTTTFIL